MNQFSIQLAGGYWLDFDRSRWPDVWRACRGDGALLYGGPDPGAAMEELIAAGVGLADGVSDRIDKIGSVNSVMEPDGGG